MQAYTTPVGKVNSPTPNAELGQVRIFPIGALFPAPANSDLYRPVDPKDPEIQALVKSIQQYGVLDPLVITTDQIILSGHRRHLAARLAGLKEVPCRVRPICSWEIDDFLPLLREFNRQREKTDTEKLREEIVSADPEEAHRRLREHRVRTSQVDVNTVEILGVKTRAAISSAKIPFLEACIHVINTLRAFWPLSVRLIHYRVLNAPPLRHASKPDSVYANNLDCYKDLSGLLTRARLVGRIPMNAIADETRPVTTWDVHQTTTPFIRREIDGLFKGYYRNLLQSQPNHIEIVVEKNTVEGIVRTVAAEYCLPLTSGRGFCSLPPRYEMAQRFKKSGKENLILLVLSDFDPDGEEICHSFARSIRDDFGIRKIQPVKVALIAEQVQQMRLPASMEAKPKSANYAKFVSKYGPDVFELEAIPPTTLQNLVREAVDSVLDLDAFNKEVDAEKQDAAHLDTVRRTMHQALQNFGFDEQDFGFADEETEQ